MKLTRKEFIAASIVNLEYFDYARSKYIALGMPDTMPRKAGN